MDNEQRRDIIENLATALVLIYEKPYNYDTGSGGTNFFQLGRAHGLYEGMKAILPNAEFESMLDEAKVLAGTMSNEQASNRFLTINLSIGASFSSYAGEFLVVD